MSRKKHIESFYPLSPTQQGMLFHSLATPGSGMYVGQISFQLQGALDVAALRRAWHQVTERHGVLRTSFRWQELKEPVQVVDRRPQPTFIEIDLRRLGPEDQRRCRSQVFREDQRRGFELTRPPLVRMTLLRWSDGDSELLWTRHHLVVDGWSVSLLFQELLRRYQALVDGSSLPLDPAPRFRDYIAWLRRQDQEAAEATWRQELAGLGEPAVFDYGTPEDPAATGEARWGDLAHEVPWSTTAALGVLGRGCGVTLATLVQGVWALLLGRYQDRGDVLFGTVVAGRPLELPGAQATVGLFINTQPLRARLPRQQSFLDWIQGLQRHLAELRHTEHLALHQIQGWSSMPRGQAMFETLLVYENYPVDPLLLGESQSVTREEATQDLAGRGLAAGGLRIVRHHARERTNYPLTVVLRQGKTLPMSIMYDRTRMSAADVQRLLGHFHRLLEEVGADPRRSLDALPWMSAAERHQLLVAWDGPVEPPPEETTLDGLVAAQARRTPDAPAVVQGEQRLTYRQLMAGARRVAAALIAAGVAPGDRVGLGLERTPQLLVALLGVLRAGAAYVPLDPAYPAARLALMMDDAGLELVLAEAGSELGARAPEGCRVLSLEELLASGDSAGEDAEEASLSLPQSPAYTIYTSGSTGKPKGVMVPHGAVVNFLTSMARKPGLEADDVLVAVTSLSFDISVLELFLPLTVGARVVLADRQQASEGRRLRQLLEGQLLEESGATVMQATPATWRLLTASGFRARPPFRQLCGGEALGRELAQQLRANGAELWNLYGPTETTIWSSVAAVDAGPRDTGPVHLGRPIANTQLRVLDHRLRLVPLGAPGELAIGGAGVTQGYLHRPALTAQRFVPDPYAAVPGARLYRTGDQVRQRAEGILDYLGRMDFQVKVRGHRIELGEVEAVLEALPEVAAAVAVVRRDSSGEGRLMAYVVPEESHGEDPSLTVDELRRRAGEALPAVMVPAVVMLLDALPLTPNGKVDRKALPEPSSERPELATELVQPRSEAEKTIAEIWRRALELDEVGLEDNFFDLGGHSILAIRVHEEIERTFQAELSLVELFEHPTVAALARRVVRAPASGTEASEARPSRRRRAPRGDEAVAVIGLAGRFPGAADADQLWKNLLAGQEAVRDISPQELQALAEEAGLDPDTFDDPHLVKRRGWLDDIDRFDAPFFGINPREAELMDPQHRLFLEVAAQALDRAGHPDETAGPIGVFAGTSLAGYLLHNVFPHLRQRGFDTPWPMILGNDKDHLATRVSYLLGLTGPSMLVQTACSTGLTAVHMARRALLAGECDLALAGASSVRVPQAMPHPYQQGGINSPDGRCRPYDAGAQGTIGGNGVAAVVLRRLDEALEDGDTVLAVIRGSALNNDGHRKVGYTAPSVEGQALAIRAALEEADIDPATVGYVEGHGTGTALGDPIEITALNRAYGSLGSQLPPGSCALGSVKSNLGHLDTAAGIAGFVKAVLAVRHGVIPPTVHFEEPSPQIPWDRGPFFVPRGLAQWPKPEGPRRAGVSSFGLGGTNVHVVLEQAPERPAAEETSEEPREHALVLSAKTATALEHTAEGLAAYLQEHEELSLADVEHTLAVGRRSHRHRRVIFASTREQTLAALEGREPARVRGAERTGRARWTAFLFPGQGTAWAGMGRRAFDSQPVFRQALERCDEILRQPLGESLLEALYGEGASDEALAQTRLAQPAVFALSYAWAELWESWGVAPDVMLGHSLGEYVAAQRAGVLALEDALRLVARRGELMQRLPAGTMLALSLSPQRFRELLEEMDGEWVSAVDLAAENGPEAIVASGPDEVMAALAEALEARGIESRRLRTSHAFHSSMMDPVLDEFRREVAAVPLRPPRAEILSNASGEELSAEEATSPEYWVRHLRNTVRFGPALKRLLEQDDADQGSPSQNSPGLLLEVGPGRALSALARRMVARTSTVQVIASLPRERDGEEPREPRRAAAEVWLAGGALDWRRLPAAGRRVPLPPTSFDDHRYWVQGSAPAETDQQIYLHLPTWRQGDALNKGEGNKGEANEAEGSTAENQVPRRWLVLAPNGELDPRLAPALEDLVEPPRWLVAGPEAPLPELIEGALEDPGDGEGRGVLWLTAGWQAGEAEFETLPALRLTQSLARHAESLGPVILLSRGQEEVFGDETPITQAWLAPALATQLRRAGLAARCVDLPPAPGKNLARHLQAALATASEAANDPRNAQRGSFWWSAGSRLESAPENLTEEKPAPDADGEEGIETVLCTGAEDPALLALVLALARRRPLRLALLSRGTVSSGTVSSGTVSSNTISQGIETSGGEAATETTELLEAIEASARQLWQETLPPEGEAGAEAVATAALERAAATLGPIDLWLHRRPGEEGSTEEFSETSDLGTVDVDAAARGLERGRRQLAQLDELVQQVAPRRAVLLQDLAEVYGSSLPALLRAEQAMAWGEHQARGGSSWRVLTLPLTAGGGRFETGGPERWLVLFDHALALPGLTRATLAPRDPRAALSRPEQTAPPAASPSAPRPATGAPFEAPASETERRLTEIWEQLLGVAPIGRHDDFFELGGHSLLATQVLARVRAVLGRDLPVRRLFEAPTVAGLAAALEKPEDAPAEAAGDETAPPLEPVERDGALPLSFAQQRLWFLDQLEPGTPVYNLPFGLRLEGSLQPEALAGAFSQLLRRHEVLRTRFESDRGEARQVVEDEASIALPTVDLGGLPAGPREREARRLAEVEARRPFDLSRGPLLRVLLLRCDPGLAPQDHRLVVTVHHIAADGWSLGVMVREVGALYQGRCRDTDADDAELSGLPGLPELPELPIQYADFAAWQRRWLAGEVLEDQLGYWRRRLGDRTPNLELPTDRPRPAVLSPDGGEVRLELPAQLSAELQRLARRSGATLFMVLLAGFEALLHRLTGQTDLVVGSPVAGRTRVETEGLIGFFVNTLVLRVDAGFERSLGDLGFGALLERVRETSLEAQGHQELPFELLVQELQPDRDLSRSPLFQVLFILQNTPLEPLHLPDLALLPWDLSTDAAPFDLTLSLSQRGEAVAGELSYRRDLFDATTVERWAGALHRLLAAAVENPATPISRLPLLTPAQEHQLSHELAPGPAPTEPKATGDETLATRLRAVADEHPDSVAIVDADGETTYGELRDRSLRLAARLRAAGIGPESPVAVALERRSRLVAALWAVAAAGGAFVPLDPRHPVRRRAQVLEDSGARLLLADRASAEALDAQGPEGQTPSRPSTQRLVLEDVSTADSSEAALSEEETPARGDSLAYVLYTSGSTGRPKGVEVRHRSLLAFLDAMAERPGLDAGDTLAAITTLTFDISLLELFLPLTRGARLALVDAETAADPYALGRRLQDVGATVMQATPAGWHQLLESGWGNPAGLPTGLRVLCGGEALPRPLARRLAAVAPEVWNLYGPTEATVWIATARIPALSEPPAEDSEGSRGEEWPIHLGQPLPGARLEVLDRHHQPVPLGVTGELYLAGPGLARGYRGLPARTAAAFVPDPRAGKAGGRLYRTGDLVRRDGRGRLIFLGRADHQVKVRGYRIEVGEVEAALLRHPGIRQAVVTAPPAQDGDAQLVAYLVTGGEGVDSEPAGPESDHTELEVSELRAFLAQHLPAYMVPSTFVSLDALPTTSSGKVDRKALPEPERARSRRAPFVAPRDPVEEAVAEIWREVLRLPEVGVHDNFFELGGHSLLATQVTSRIFESFGTELPLRRLFAEPTVAGLSTAVREAQTESLDASDEELLRRIEEMSEENLDEALSQMLAGKAEES
ncbi:MAG: amino acid adenylation domain-containing protein [Acidobacteriota bacterium]|nr:amino acid adenylation domain-containing protein [Acidobacteriota bacterium]